MTATMDLEYRSRVAEPASACALDASMAGDTPSYEIDILGSLEDAEHIWRSFERAALMSPYQAFDWVATWHRCFGALERVRPLIVVVRHMGVPSMLLPLGLIDRSGITKCVFLGGKQINYAMPLLSGDWSEAFGSAPAIETVLKKIKQAEPSIDLFAFFNQPRDWHGQKNPMLQLVHKPSPSNSFCVPLRSDYQEFAAGRRSAKSLSKLRRKEEKIAREIGPIRLIEPVTSSEIDWALDLFRSQRLVRFSALGIPDPYQTSQGRQFLREATLGGEGQGQGTLRWFVLMAGDTPIATFAGTQTGRHFSGFINSMLDGDFAKYSPGEVLLIAVLRRLCAEGVEWFDLGIGEARYKEQWCDVDPLVDAVVPMSTRGRLVMDVIRRMRGMKRSIKQNTAVFSSLKRSRAILRRLFLAP